MKTTLSALTAVYRFEAIVGAGLLLLGLLLTGKLQAQCNGEISWESISTNRMRCGIEGHLTNDTYYLVSVVELWEWHYPACGTATSYFRVRDTYPAASNPRVCNVDCSAPTETILDDAANIPSECGESFGSWWLDSFNDEYPLCTSTSLPTNPEHTYTITDSVYQHDEETEYGSPGNASICEGTKLTRLKQTLSSGYTLRAFADDALADAKAGSWIDAGTGLTSGAYLTTDEQRQCVSAGLTRYYIRFKSKLGANHNVTWEILLTSNFRTNQLGGSWADVGDGTEMKLGPFYLPDPLIDESYVARLIKVEVQTEGGGCSSGNCNEDGNDSAGDGEDHLASAAFWISLGAGTIDESAGVIKLDEALPSASLATPAALQFNIKSSVVTVVTNVDGSIHLAAPTLLARIVVTNAYAYWIHCSVTNGGAYLTNSPFISHLIINPHGSTNTNTLRHVRFRSGSAITNDFVCESATAFTNTWTLTSGNGLKGERLTKITYTNSTRLEQYSVFTPATAAELYRRHRLYWVPFNGEFLLSEIIDPSGMSLVTTNTYDSLGLLQSSVRPEGSWERHEYDANGRRLRIVTPFTNQPPTASTNDCRVTEYGYSSASGSDNPSTVQVGKPRTVWELIRGEVVSKTMFSHPDEFTTHTQIAAAAANGWNHVDNEKSSHYEDSEHRPTQMDHADGTRTTISYTDNSGGRLTVTKTGAHTSGTFNEGTQFEEQVDTLGRMLWRTNRDIASTKVISGESYTDRDEFLRPTKISYLDGTSSVTVKQDCCNAAYTIDRDGVTNTFAYDALKRLISTTRLGITSSNVLDAADHVLFQRRRGTNGNVITLRSVAYDAANRVIRETNALGAVTSYSYVVDGNNQQVNTTTNADGGIRTETYFRDGQLASVTGTAAFPVRYAYGKDSAGAYTAEIKLEGSGADTMERTTNYTDAFARSYKTIFAGSSGPYRQSFYNNKGQLWKQRDPDGNITLYTNNSRGELEYTAISSNRSDAISFGGLDRITRTVNDVVSSHSADVLRTRNYVLETFGSSTETLLSSSERSADGLRTWVTNAGALTMTVRTVPSGGAYTETRTTPDNTYSISLYQNGRLSSVTQHDSTGAQVGKVSYTYDAHGRRNTMTDARNGTTTYTFNEADQMVSVITPAPGTGAGPQITTTSYDLMGRATTIVQPDGTTLTSVFSPRGELLLSSGSRTYPVGYAYDAQGRMKHMTNWTTFASGAGARVTTWHYDAGRGWLTNKVYDDGKGTKYSYTAAGRLSSRLWARGTNTSYSYNDYGDLSGVSYNDGATPTVTYNYDRRGRQEKISRGSDSWRLFYTVDGRLISEAGTAGTLNGLRITNSFDEFLRRTNVATFDGGTQLTTNGYSYDAASRLSTAREGVFSATYTYLANSPLAGQIEFRSNSTVRLTTTKHYDKLNRLTSISSVGSGSDPSITSFAYSYNDANQRTRVNLGDGSFWIYEYDSLGQLKSGKRYWSDWTPVAGQQFEYGFDDIGNRTSTKAGGDERGANLRTALYTNNSLNQIVGRDIPAYINVIGAASATATNVNVNNSMAYRRGEYYRVELNPANTSTAVWQSVTNRAVQNGATNSQTGNIFLPKTAEAFAYDADGNTTTNGQWVLSWDGENRLVRMVANTAVGPQQRIDFDYDWQGRRIAKTVWNDTAGTSGPKLKELFPYDSWNLVAQLNATNNAVLNAYLWGTDLSGSLQEAGGVGGLLTISSRNVGAGFTAYDGNGNIAALINAAGGNALANYEFGPFGEAIRSSDSSLQANPLRFSTKFEDKETGLLCYGHRYYDPSKGRWLKRDPIEEDGGLNLNAMLNNDCINYVDLIGLKEVKPYDNSCCTPDKVRRGKLVLDDKFKRASEKIKASGANPGGSEQHSCNAVNSALLILMSPIPPCWQCSLEQRYFYEDWAKKKAEDRRDHHAVVCKSVPLNGKPEEALYDYWGERSAGEDPNKWFRRRYRYPDPAPAPIGIHRDCDPNWKPPARPIPDPTETW